MRTLLTFNTRNTTISVSGPIMKTMDSPTNKSYCRKITAVPIKNTDLDTILSNIRRDIQKPFTTIEQKKKHIHYSKKHSIEYATKHIMAHGLTVNAVLHVSFTDTITKELVKTTIVISNSMGKPCAVNEQDKTFALVYNESLYWIEQ